MAEGRERAHPYFTAFPACGDCIGQGVCCMSLFCAALARMTSYLRVSLGVAGHHWLRSFVKPGFRVGRRKSDQAALKYSLCA